MLDQAGVIGEARVLGSTAFPGGVVPTCNGRLADHRDARSAVTSPSCRRQSIGVIDGDLDPRRARVFAKDALPASPIGGTSETGRARDRRQRRRRGRSRGRPRPAATARRPAHGDVPAPSVARRGGQLHPRARPRSLGLWILDGPPCSPRRRARHALQGSRDCASRSSIRARIAPRCRRSATSRSIARCTACPASRPIARCSPRKARRGPRARPGHARDRPAGRRLSAARVLGRVRARDRRRRSRRSSAPSIPPLRRRSRQPHHPLVIAGGPLTFSNPAPLAPFCRRDRRRRGRGADRRAGHDRRDVGFDRERAVGRARAASPATTLARARRARAAGRAGRR